MVFTLTAKLADEILQALRVAVGTSGSKSTTTPKKSTTPAPTPISDPEEDSKVVDEDFDIFGDDETPQEEEAVAPVDKETLTSIRSSFKNSDTDTKSQVKSVLSNYNGKLASEMRPSDVEKIKTILGI